MPNLDPTAYLHKQESTIFRKLLPSKKKTWVCDLRAINNYRQEENRDQACRSLMLFHQGQLLCSCKSQRPHGTCPPALLHQCRQWTPEKSHCLFLLIPTSSLFISLSVLWNRCAKNNALLEIQGFYCLYSSKSKKILTLKDAVSWLLPVAHSSHGLSFKCFVLTPLGLTILNNKMHKSTQMSENQRVLRSRTINRIVCMYVCLYFWYKYTYKCIHTQNG